MTARLELRLIAELREPGAALPYAVLELRDEVAPLDTETAAIVARQLEHVATSLGMDMGALVADFTPRLAGGSR